MSAIIIILYLVQCLAHGRGLVSGDCYGPRQGVSDVLGGLIMCVSLQFFH